jgi:hypothetical protein
MLNLARKGLFIDSIVFMIEDTQYKSIGPRARA